MKKSRHSNLAPGETGFFRRRSNFSTSILICTYLFFTLFSACRQSPAPAGPAAPDTADLFANKAVIKYARGFSIEYHGSYKLVNIISHSGKKPDTLKYVLVQRGTTSPSGYEGAQRIEIPVRTMTGMSSMHVAIADFAECANIITGLGSLQYVNSTLVRKNIRAGKVKQIGTEGTMNDELILAMHPDLVMAVSSPDARFSKYQMLTNAGIPVLLNAEWLEVTPLGRAEWVKLMAALVNKEELVNKKFGNIEQEYQKIAALGRKTVQKPSAIIGMPFKGNWFVPDGGSYMAEFMRDAGISYHWSEGKGTGSLSLDFETVAPVALKANFWLNPGFVNSKADIKAADSRYQDFKPFRNNTIYNDNNRVNEEGSNDYWESGAVNPHIILADLIKIAHPGLLPEHKLVYYKQMH